MPGPLTGPKARGTVRFPFAGALCRYESLRSWLAALALLCAATPSHAANWLEMNFWLSGPRYSGKVPACDDGWALSSIQHKFSSKEGRFWNSNLSITGFDRIHETAYRPMGAGYDPAPFLLGDCDGFRRRPPAGALPDRRGSRPHRRGLGRGMVRGRARPQLGLQPGLPDGAALTELIPFYFLFVLVLFSSRELRSGLPYVSVGASMFPFIRIQLARAAAIAAFALTLFAEPLPPRRRSSGRNSVGAANPGNSTSTFWPCRGRRPSARRRANARRIAARRSSNAATGPIISSCTGCGRNMSAASRANVRSRRRGSTATSCRPCST